MTSSRVPDTRPARPIRGLSGINCSMLSVPHGPAGDSGTVFRNIGTQRRQVFDRFRRPNDVHFADRLGAGRSRLPPQELTHALTCSCGTLSPRSSVPIAFRTPATRHLPFVDIEICAERLGCEKRSAASGASCKFLQPLFNIRFDTNCERS